MDPKLMRSIKRSVNRLSQAVDDSLGPLETSNLWMVVMFVTCVEAYLQDALCMAASADPALMSKSGQSAYYGDVLGATSLDELAADMRTRWARGWLNDGGPTRWLSRLDKMGARGYPDDLAPRLERIWGIRHVVVHAAGVATADFVKRHPIAKRGDRLRVTNQDIQGCLQAVKDFVGPTEAFFLARSRATKSVNQNETVDS
jgi:hypothetical protein